MSQNTKQKKSKNRKNDIHRIDVLLTGIVFLILLPILIVTSYVGYMETWVASNCNTEIQMCPPIKSWHFAVNYIAIPALSIILIILQYKKSETFYLKILLLLFLVLFIFIPLTYS